MLLYIDWYQVGQAGGYGCLALVAFYALGLFVSIVEKFRNHE